VAAMVRPDARNSKMKGCSMITVDEKTFRDITKKVGADKMAEVERASGIAIEVPVKVEEFLTRPLESVDKPMTVAERNRGKVDHVLVEHKTVESNTEQIIQLHNEIEASEKVNLGKAYSIGELLLETKKRIKHGHFGSWMAEYLPFSKRTAQNYMKLFLHREELEKQGVQSLTEAYAHLKGEATPDEVIDADDSLDTKGKWVIVNGSVDVDNLNLPKKKAHGLMDTLTVDKEVIHRIRNQEHPFKNSKERYRKLVVQIPRAKDMDDRLIGEFVCAVSTLLKPGGKLIFHKK